jgi:hypothetical protein
MMNISLMLLRMNMMGIGWVRNLSKVTSDFLDSKGYVLVHELNNQDDVYMSQEFFNQYSCGGCN